MLKLDKSSPQTPSCEMDEQRISHELFSFLETTVSDLEKYALKVDFPLTFRNPLGVGEDLTSSLDLTSEFEMLGIVKHSHRHLLGGDFVAASLYDLPGFLKISNLELESGSQEPYFPFKIIRTVHYGIAQETDSLIQVA